MELAFLTLLLKDGADSVCGGVAIDDEWVIKTWLTKDRGHAHCVDEGLKGGLVFLFPMEFTSFSAMCNEHIEGGGQETKVSNVHAIKVEETQKRA